MKSDHVWRNAEVMSIRGDFYYVCVCFGCVMQTNVARFTSKRGTLGISNSILCAPQSN